jgi:DNA repair exonuclease SbcCD nuclease subunit
VPDFEFLHAADLHLDSPLRGLDADAPADRIRGATREALTKLVDLALERRVAFLLLAGDLYDGDWKDWRTGHFLIEQLSRLKRAGIDIIAISGNHDAEQVLTRNLKLPFPGTMLPSRKPETHRLHSLEVAIHGQSFGTRAVTENLARFYPKPEPGWFNIGLLHTACESTDHAPYAPCTEAELAAHGYDYWALGHVHTRRDIQRGDCRIVFPGNVQGRHIREEGAKGASLVRVTAGRIEAVEHHALDVLRWKHVHVDASGAADMDAVLARIELLLNQALIEAEGRLLAVRVTLNGASPAHAAMARRPEDFRAQVRAAALGIADGSELWIEDVRLRTRPEALLATHSGAVGDLAAALNRSPAIDTAMYEFVSQLVKDPDLLEAGHPALAIREGEPGDPVPDDLVQRARALLLAELMAGSSSAS